MTSEAIDESGVNVFIFAFGLGSGTARRFESKPPDANEPSDMGQLKPGRRTAALAFSTIHRLLFLYRVPGAMRQPVAASDFVRLCAGRITRIGARRCRRKRLNPVADLQR